MMKFRLCLFFMLLQLTVFGQNVSLSIEEQPIHSVFQILENEYLEFKQDYIFNSPSMASSIVLGRNSNGWINWKNKEGKTLDELKRQ